MRIKAVTSRCSVLAATGALLGALLGASPSAAAPKASGLYITGAGNGHGVGMSQYGAAGYALHGASYSEILRDYYAGTTLGHVAPDRIVTVLLRSSGSAVFSGATTIKGFPRKLNPLWNYSVLPVGPRLRVRLGRKLVGTFDAPLQVTGPTPVKLNGLGSYRGALVFQPNPKGNGVMTINAVGLDDYVQGVVSAEMPSGWPAAGARGAGGRGPQLRDRIAPGHGGLPGVRQHELPDVRGRAGGDARRQRGGRRDQRPGRRVRGRTRGHLLLLELGRRDREHPERLSARPRGLARRAGPTRTTTRSTTPTTAGR